MLLRARRSQIPSRERSRPSSWSDLAEGQTDSASRLYLHPLHNMSSQVENLLPSPELNNNATPPRTTPSPDAADPGVSWFHTYYLSRTFFTYHNASELKLSRKREREVSVEPVTTPTASNVLEFATVFFYLCTHSKSLLTG